jgi:hypothetical protein
MEEMLKRAFPPETAQLLGDLITLSENVGYDGDDAGVRFTTLLSGKTYPSAHEQQVEALRLVIQQLHDPNYLLHKKPKIHGVE